VRHDVNVLSDPSPSSTAGPDSSPSERPSPARPRVRAWIWPTVLGVLVTATCLTVAVFASAWLVAPYLVGMALILGVPRPLRLAARALAGWLQRGVTAYRHARRPDAPSGADGRRARPELESDPESNATAADEADASSSDDPPASLPEAPGAKPRRARGRARKARPAPVAESPRAAARWVRVGPGKFVRVEAGDPLPETESAEDPDASLQEPEVRDEPETSASDNDGQPSPDPRRVAHAEETDGDNGNAPDAPEVSTPDDPAEETVPEAVRVAEATVSETRCEPGPEPATRGLRCVGASPAVVVDGALAEGVSVDERTARREPAASRVAMRRGRGLAVPRVGTAVAVAPRWNARAGRTTRVFPGFLRPAPVRRNLRHSGRFHHADRTYPPRSPPALTR
jgi:hypothetical protein